MRRGRAIMSKPVTEHSWPRNLVKSIETRKHDIVIRISDWTRDKDEPAYDVEVYAYGVYDWNLSASFTRYGIQKQRAGLAGTGNGRPWKAVARQQAIAFAQKSIAEMVR